MGERELFDVGERTVLPGSPCTAAPVGTGPSGEKCGTCSCLVHLHYHDGRYLKCGLMRVHWTHGAASDVKAKWPACRAWRLNDRDEEEGTQP